jgi:hypothetical protein
VKRLVLVVALLPAVAAAQERLSDYQHSAMLEGEGSGSHYRFSLPAHAYRGTAQRDLGDIRIFNAAGEPVPYAFADFDSKPAAPEVHAARFFPLLGDPAKGLEATAVKVERTRSGTVVSISVTNGAPAGRRVLLGYVLDPGELKAPQQALLLRWQTRDSFSGQARVEASSDLNAWSTLVSGAPLLYLEHNGSRLERHRIELGGARPRYLRLSFSGIPRDFALSGVDVELQPAKPEPAREWLPLTPAQGKAAGELHVDTAGHFPVDRVRLRLPQPNTVVRVQFLARERPGEEWRFVAAATAYRLSRETGEDIVSPDIAIPRVRDRYWMIRVDQKGGGTGAGALQVELGWLPHEIVFVARGERPFQLGYGNRKAKAGALPLSTVLPLRDERELADVKSATVQGLKAVERPAPSLFREPGRFLNQLAEHRELKKWLLWGALVLGVVVLAGMALRLLRNVGSG